MIEKLFSSPKANMYGCAPCPKCGDEFRVPYGLESPRPADAGKIVCENCGYRVEYDAEEEA